MNNKRSISLCATVGRHLLKQVYGSSIRRGYAAGHDTLGRADSIEAENFKPLAKQWWAQQGIFSPLEALNQLRVPMIRDALCEANEAEATNGTMTQSRILDIGCGGGLLSLPLARLGARVTGVDIVEESIAVAQQILPAHLRDSLQFRCVSAEQLVNEDGNVGTYDAVVLSEVLEHVTDWQALIANAAELLKPQGHLFITTLNRTPAAYWLGVVAAERWLGLVPPGTHDWNKFLLPSDVEFVCSNLGLVTRLCHGMMYNPLTGRWSWISNTAINYTLHAIKI